MAGSDIKSILAEVRALMLDLYYARVALKLTKKPVKLEWIEPAIEDVRGLTLRDGAKALIQIKPDLDPEQRFKTFLHECAHAALHFDGLADISELGKVLEIRELEGKQAAPEWVMEKRRAAHDKREAEADAMVNFWLKIAGDGPIRQRLQRLLD